MRDPCVYLCDNQPSVYKRNGKELVIFPSLPKWIMLAQGGFDTLCKFDGMKYSQCLDIVDADTLNSLLEYGVLVYADADNTPKETSKLDRYPLLAVWFNVTEACNLSCKHCFVGGGRKVENELELIEIEQLLIDMAKVGGRERIELDITGGEPLLRNDIVEIIKICKKFDFRTRVITNGLLLTSDLSAFFAASDVPLLISLDGANAETHDQVRGVGTFKRTYANIRTAVKNGAKVAIGMTLYSGNQSEVEDFIELGKELGVAHVNFSLLNEIGNASENNIGVASNYEILQHLLDLAEKDDKTRALLKGGYLSRMVSSVYLPIRTDCCGSGVNTCSIGSNGNVYPCPSFQSSTYSVGNIREERFDKIWRDSQMLSICRSRKAIDLNDECRICDLRLLCGGGCRGNATLGGKLDFSTKNPRCDVVKKGYIDTLFRIEESPILEELVVAGVHGIEH